MERRFFINKDNITNNQITILGDEFTHLTKVLRAKVGEQIECFYDGSQIYNCCITDITKTKAVCNILKTTDCACNPKVEVTAFVAGIKLSNFELIVQKLCELGVSNIIPFTSRYTNIKQELRTDRLQKISISACKQCERTSLLKIESIINFKQMTEKLKDYNIVIFANEHGGKNLENQNISDKGNVALVIGPEGGFSQEEANTIINAGAIPVTLGKRILKAETAAIVLTTLIMQKVGELS